MEKVGRETIGGSMPWKRAPKIGISPERIGLSRVQTVESDDAIVPMMASACFGSNPSHTLVIGSPSRSMKRAPSQFKRISMTLGSSKARQINSPSSSRSLRAKRRRVSSVDIPPYIPCFGTSVPVRRQGGCRRLRFARCAMTLKSTGESCWRLGVCWASGSPLLTTNPAHQLGVRDRPNAHRVLEPLRAAAPLLDKEQGVEPGPGHPITHLLGDLEKVRCAAVYRSSPGRILAKRRKRRVRGLPELAELHREHICQFGSIR